jgi:predicted double-glycine peptidase
MVMLVTYAIDARAAGAGRQSVVSRPHRLLDVPYLPQTAELCGGAAVAMVMRYWGDRAVLPADFRTLVSSPSGIVTTDLARAVDDRGWTALTREADPAAPIADLQRDVDQGRPVIALIEDSPGTFHYVVVVGVTSDNRVVVHDPARTSFRVVAADSFDSEWRGSHRWRMLVMPSASQPVVAVPISRPGDSTKSARVGACGAMIDGAVTLADRDRPAAERALRAATDLCPTLGDPWLELAGIQFRAKAWREAGDLAERSLAIDPNSADGWSLLATSRFLDDDMASALAAWNHVGEPKVDTVAFTGAHRTPQPALVRLTGLEPGMLLTPSTLALAARRFADAPSAEATRLTFTTSSDGRAAVTGALVERPVLPIQPAALGVLALRAAVTNEVRAVTSGLFSQGEMLTLDYRWPAPRPRVGAILNVPAPAPLNGVVTIEGLWEKESYSISAPDGTKVTTIDSHRRATFDLGTWVTPNVRINLGAGLDRINDRDHASFHAAVERHWYDDRVVGRLDGETWRLGGAAFSTAAAMVVWTSTTDITRSAASVVAGFSSTSATSPRVVWEGAGTGSGRLPLLRAHPLLDEDVLDGPVFGRQLAFTTAEFTRPITRRFFGPLSVAAFVDAAQAWRRLDGSASPFEVDAGIGVRLQVPSSGNVARADIARGLRDGGFVLSAGWTVTLSRVFSRRMPW